MTFFEDWGKQLEGYDKKKNEINLKTSNKQCFDSSTCASGYACIGGECTKIETAGPGSGGYFGPNPVAPTPIVSAGSCNDKPTGGGAGGCASPSGGNNGIIGCTTPTCGEGKGGYGAEDSGCCGEVCYRRDRQTGEVIRTCGPCYEDDDFVDGLSRLRCNQYCDSYFKNFGEDFAGCSESNTCDECETCQLEQSASGYASACVPATGGPCHCDGVELDDCETCNSDGSTSRSDNCNLLSCCWATEECCGEQVSVYSCSPEFSQACTSALQAARQACANSGCTGDVNCDPQQVNNGRTICSPGGCPENPEDGVPANTAGVNNVWTGCIEGNGEHCVLYNEEVYGEASAGSGDSSDCKVECNCDQDCDTCEYCDSKGECQVNPDCCPDGRKKCGNENNESEFCCPENSRCYDVFAGFTPGTPISQDCCDKDRVVRDIWVTTWTMGYDSCDNEYYTETFYTYGVPDWYVGSYTNSNGDVVCGNGCNASGNINSTTDCDDPFARLYLVINNGYNFAFPCRNQVAIVRTYIDDIFENFCAGPTYCAKTLGQPYISIASAPLGDLCCTPWP